MKKKCLILILLQMLVVSCDNKFDVLSEHIVSNLPKYSNLISIDSTYTYQGDSLYMAWLDDYNANIGNITTRALSPEDDAFFSKKYIVKSTEMTLLYGRNYIYPSAILEGNSISGGQFVPIYVAERNPITVSMSLTHNTPKSTRRTIESPTFSKLNDYVKEMVVDGNFQQNEKFMFQYKRFTFFDEIKSAFGSNVNTQKLFSSKSESSMSESYRISKSTGMYVKFFQSSFTVSMDIEPLSNKPIVGNSGFEPVYVNSLSYGRMGIIVFETDETYDFAQSCISKEFDRIFYNKSSTLTQKERLFFDQTEFKVLIIGADSDYAVQTFQGYSHFLNLIYNSRFTQNSFGVPISCSFGYANTHGLVEIEFENRVLLEPLYVSFAYDNTEVIEEPTGYRYDYTTDRCLYFYKDREKTKPARPTPDIVFEVYWSKYNCREQMDEEKCIEDSGTKKLRNINYDTKLYVGNEYDTYWCSGPRNDEEETDWESRRTHQGYVLQYSPFFITVR